jgi:nicotinamide-nucleotide amidase
MENINEKKQKPVISSIEILCVGTEILMGQITNTNAAFLAKEMSLIGIPHYYQTVVGDNPARLQKAISDALMRSDAILLTGGLGPTADDITMEIAARSVGLPLEFHEESARIIQAMFDRMNRPMTPNNLKQAMLPQGCIPLPNKNGTAPGAIIETNADMTENHSDSEIPGEKSVPGTASKVLVMLPGPPSEMKAMFESQVKPYLMERAPVSIASRFVRLFGIGESAAETKLKDLIEAQTNPTIAPYCSDGECMFRISSTRAKTSESEILESEDARMDDLITKVKDRLGEFIYEIGDRSMPHVVYDLLDHNRKTVSFAESCTAGIATSMMGDISGASRVLRGGIIAYHNDIKEQVLHVPSDTLATYGAVSKETALAMARGCRELMNSDYSVSLTGVAGPAGGTAEKPVGLVYIGLHGPNCEKHKELHLTGSRSKIRYIASLHAYDLLRRTLLDDTGQETGKIAK